MKLVALVLASLSLNASAQKLTAAKVPAAAKAAFSKAYPHSTAAWEKEDGNYEASFQQGGKEASCVITGKGVILETETPLTLAEMPTAAVAYVKQHHKNAKIKETAKIEKQSGEIIYEIAVAGKDLLFDGSGKLLKSGKD